MDNDFATGYALGSDNNGGGNDGMWGGNGSWIFAFLIIALIFGGNGWGWGNNGGNGAGYQGAVTRSDLCSEFNFNNLSRSVLGIQDGLCNGFYSMNNGMLTGFNTLGSAVSNGFHGVDNSVCQLGYARGSGAKLNREMAERWVRGMKNADGSTGAHWTLDQTTELMQRRGINYNPVKFWVAMNAVYSDLSEVAERHGVGNDEFYADMAKSFWLCDKDAVEDKLAAYYENVVKHN